MPTITLEVQDRGKAIPLLEAALHRQVAYVDLGVAKRASACKHSSSSMAARWQRPILAGSPSIPLSASNGKGKPKCCDAWRWKKPGSVTVRICA